MKKLVMIESPYRNGNRQANLDYLAWCEYDAASRGELPISSHGNCTAYWPETDEAREQGFAWRDAVRAMCACVAYYTDLGVSPGMSAAIERDGDFGDVRKLAPESLAAFSRGERPPGSMRRVVA